VKSTLTTHPFYSVLPDDEPNQHVYHDRSDCPDGLRVKLADCRQGTGNRRHCPTCASMAGRHSGA
jgi:hypothetical protein